MPLPPGRAQGAISLPDDRRKLQAQKLSDVYRWRQMKMWRPFRFIGLLTSFFAFSFNIICVCSKKWIVGKDFHVGVIDQCYMNGTTFDAQEICLFHTATWTTIMIGLLSFSVAFGFLGFVLSVCGIISTTLDKKMYYYHSAGEIYFICAVLCAGAMMTYPVAIYLETEPFEHTYGYGYGLGWGASVTYFTSSVCMSLDDLMRAIIKGRCCR